jgi:hypothetical protein
VVIGTVQTLAMWPFRKKPTAEQAVTALRYLCYCAEMYKKHGETRFHVCSGRPSARECLRVMLRRQPTEAEVREVFDEPRE